MAKYRIGSPDGGTFEITAPDDATPDQVLDYVKKNMGTSGGQGATETQAAPAQSETLSELDRKMDERVAKEAAGGFAPQPSVAKGLPVGSWLDEASAGLDAGLNAVSGGHIGQPYAEGLAYQHARDRYIAKNHPTAQTLSSIAGAVASAPLMPVARVMQGATMLPRIVNSAVNGGLYGGLYGSGEGDTLGDKAENAALGVGVGAGLGAIAPPVEAGIANAIGGVRDAFRPLPHELAGYSKNSVNRVAALSHMDELDGPAYQAAAQRLGPEGALADMGENLRIGTEGLAQQPGPQRRIIAGALDPRADAAPDRIRQTLDQNMGLAANVPQTIAHLEQHYGAQAAPLYDAFYQTRIPMNPTLQTLYARANASGAVDRARQLMQIDGFNPDALMQQNLTGREWDYIKRGIDDLASQADRRGLTEGVRRFGNLARQIRTGVDLTISPGNADQSIWAQARAVAGDGIGARAAIEEGRQAFNKGLSADQLQADMAGRSALERDAYQVGSREQLRSNMDTAATNFGPNGDATVRRLLNSPENQRKMEMIVGQQPAANIQSRIGAENTMSETHNQVFGNSATARRQAARDVIPRQYDQANYNQIGAKSASGAVFEGVARLANFLTAGALNERNARVAAEMADMLVAQGLRRDQVARAIIGYSARQQLSQAQRDSIQTFVRQFITAARPSAVNAVTSQPAS